MFKMFRRIYQIFATLTSATEKTAKSLERLAAAAEEASEDFLMEERLKRQKRLEELRRELASTRPSAPVGATGVSRSSGVEIIDVTNRNDAPPKKDQQFEDAHIISTIDAEEENSQIFARPRLKTNEADPICDIQSFVVRRGIKYLVHFTREVNLTSILQRGLVTRDVLRAESREGDCNDRHRLDGTDAICASIGFPNYKMFFTLRQEHKEIDWVLLAINPSVLWTRTVAFCVTNAASNVVNKVPLEQRMGLAAMEAMFDDYGDKGRAALGLPDSYPTNPQAEVLLLDGVPRQDIIGIIAMNEAQKARIESRHASLQVVVNADWYRWRNDYEYWR